MQPHEDLVEFLERAKESVEVMQRRESGGIKLPKDYDLEDL